MEQRGGCSLWLIVASMSLAVLVWLAFKLPSAALTQIGIALDLVAAFLVTPELLGTARLAWVERSTRAVADWLIERAHRAARRTLVVAPGAIGFPLKATLSYIVVGGVSSWFIYGLLRFPILILTGKVALSGDFPLVLIVWLLAEFALSTADMIPLGIFLLLSSLNFVLLESHWLYERIDRRDPAGRLVFDISTKLLWITLFPGHFLIGITNLFFGFPALLVSVIAGKLQRALNKEGRLVRVMVPLGIAAFIVGELYQFLGTF